MTFDPIFPINPDRAVAPVEFRRLSAIEREEERQSRERKRQRQRKAENGPSDGSDDGRPKIDIRV
jgi:hypothetical protein